MSNHKPSERQRQTARLKKLWEKEKKRREQVKARRGRCTRGDELIRTLELMHQSTGDPVFDDALRAARAYGFDKSPARAARRADETIFGSDDEGNFVQIRFLVEKGIRQGDDGTWKRAKVSIHEACEIIAAEQGRAAASFKAATEQLRQGFLARRRRTSRLPATAIGNLGYRLEISAANGIPIRGPDGQPLPLNSVQPNTLFWRKKFREGVIAIKFSRQ